MCDSSGSHCMCSIGSRLGPGQHVGLVLGPFSLRGGVGVSWITSLPPSVVPVFVRAVKQHRRDAERKEQERKAKAQIEFQKGSMQLPTGKPGESTHTEQQ